MRQKKKFESELNFCSNKLTVSTLASPRTFRVAMVSAPTLPKFQAYRLRIYVVYTPYFLRTLLFLPYLLPSPSSLFLEFFFYFIWDIPGIFSRIFFVLYSIYVVYSWNFFWNFSRIFFYIYYICRGFSRIFFGFLYLTF